MEILNARENKKNQIEKFLNEYKTIIVIKANIVGNNKNVFPAHLLIRRFKEEVLKKIKADEELFESFDGPYYILKTNDEILKSSLIEIEETTIGRLIDIDLYKQIKSISRIDLNKSMRKCLICDNDSFNCIRNKRHSFEEVYHQILEITIKTLINEAMEKELKLDDKFGLVTINSNGSHKDMDYSLMVKAKDAIIPGLVKLFFLGYESISLNNLQQDARKIGLATEKEMFNVTKNVNCYQGLIFVLGMTLVSLGYVISHKEPFSKIFNNIKKINEGITNEVKTRKYKGAREEVENGLINVQSVLNQNYPQDIMKLVYLIQNVDDTILIKRSKSFKKYQEYKNMVKQITFYDNKKIKEISDLFIKNNLSCGGSADLLVVCFLLEEIRKDFI